MTTTPTPKPTTPTANFVYTPSGSGSTASTASFPTTQIIPSGFRQYADTAVPGMDGVTTYQGPGTPQGSDGGPTNDARFVRETATTTPTTLGSALTSLLHDSDPNAILSIQKELIKAGYLNPHDSRGFIAGSVTSSDATYYAYAQAMGDAIEKNEKYGKWINGLVKNPKNTLGQGYWATYQQDQDAAKNGGATPLTSTNVSNNLTDATDARAAAQNEYQSMLGRNLTDKEAQAFYGALDSFEKANPNVTTSTQDYNAAGQGTDSNSTTVGGVNPDQFAQSYVMQNDPTEYAQSQGDQVYKLFANLIGGGA